MNATNPPIVLNASHKTFITPAEARSIAAEAIAQGWLRPPTQSRHSKAGIASAQKLTAEQRQARARHAANSRWNAIA